MDAPSPLTGKLLGGRYRIGAMLGAGGMGAVYEAVQEGLDRKVALKVLHPHLAGEKELLGRFQREARVVAGLGHPNVVQISDFQAPPGEPPFLVMELLRGQNLRDVLKHRPQLSQGRVAYIAMQVLSALDAAHRARVVHRDIKPDNIFLEQTNVQADIVKVLDFGVAKLLGADEEAGNKLTRQGFVVGTLAYMAPEQASGEGVDGRSDLYSLGACMYVAIAGRKPFEAPSTTAMLRSMMSEPPVPLTAIRQDVDAAFWRVVERSLAKKKEDRFAGAPEMARALAPFARPTTLEIATQSVASPPPTTQPTAPEIPRELPSEPTPAPATVPDDSGSSRAPHTAPLPTRPAPEPVPATVPITQPMTATELPRLEATARLTPPTAIGPLIHQASPLPVAVAPAPAPRRALGPWLVVGAVAASVLGAGLIFATVSLRRTEAPAPLAPARPLPAATSSAVVASTLTPVDPAESARPAAVLAASSAPRSAPLTPPHPTAIPAATATGARQPIVCDVARRMHDTGQAHAAARLAAQCVEQGGAAPF